MRALITGGAGFLGSHLAAHCAQRGARPVIVDIARAAPSEYPPDTEFHVGDVRDPAVMSRVLEPAPQGGTVDVVVHAAAALPLWRPADIRSTAIDGTRVVLRPARVAGVERVVYISSTAVYGVPEKHPIEEEDPLIGVA